MRRRQEKREEISHIQTQAHHVIEGEGVVSRWLPHAIYAIHIIHYLQQLPINEIYQTTKPMPVFPSRTLQTWLFFKFHCYSILSRICNILTSYHKCNKLGEWHGCSCISVCRVNYYRALIDYKSKTQRFDGVHTIIPVSDRGFINTCIFFFNSQNESRHRFSLLVNAIATVVMIVDDFEYYINSENSHCNNLWVWVEACWFMRNVATV